MTDIAKHRRTPLWGWLLLILAAGLVFATQYHTLLSGLRVLPQADVKYVLGAAAASLATFFVAALTYTLIALKPIPYRPTVVVQAASMFVDRLLPAGLGAIGLNYLYLRRQKLSFAQASSTVLANNLLGFIGHFLVLAVALAVFKPHLTNKHLPHLNATNTIMPTVLVVVLGVGLVVLGKYAPRLMKQILAVAQQLAAYRRRPGSLLAGLLSSMCLTLLNVLALWLACQALGVNLSLPIVLVLFTFGVGLGTATPTPGGLGGTEAGLVAGLLLYNVSSVDAVAVVVLFRLCNFWLPLVVGVGAFGIARPKRYI